MNDLAYLYAVTRRDGAAPAGDLHGVAGRPVRLLPHADLAAAVSTVSAGELDEEPLRRNLEDVDWLERTARAHQGVVDALAAAGSVLPLRLAVVYHGDDSVHAMLADQESRLGGALDRLERRIEWGVKVYMENDTAGTAEQPRP